MRTETHEIVKDGFLWKTVDVYPQTQGETEFLRCFVAMSAMNASVMNLKGDGISFGAVVMTPAPEETTRASR